MTAPNGKQPERKLPVRGDAIVVPVEFEDAIKAALQTPPPPKTSKKRRAGTRRRKVPADASDTATEPP